MDIDPSFWDFRVLSRTYSVYHGRVSPSHLLGRRNEEYPENIEMESMEMANPYGHSDNGYGKHLLKCVSYPGKKVKFSGLRAAIVKDSQ